MGKSSRGDAGESKDVYCFMDFRIGNEELRLHRVIYRLNSRDCPNTAENFRALCTGDNGLRHSEDSKKLAVREAVVVQDDTETNDGLLTSDGLTFNSTLNFLSRSLLVATDRR